jgi:hypothetical protein
MDQLMNIASGLWRAVTPLTQSAFPARRPPSAPASATVIEYLSEAAAVFELAWTRSVTILSEARTV